MNYPHAGPSSLQCKMLASLALAIFALGSSAFAADEYSLKDIRHIVLFMQENRAFDHYFGSMAGVRGFQDPNAHISNNTGKDVFHQPVKASALASYSRPKNNETELLPWHLNWQGGDWYNRTQCMVAGSNSWQANHAAWNNGQIDQWVNKNTPYSIGYYRREDVPVHFALAESFIVGDAYYESALASTYPNRAIHLSGSLNANGSVVGGQPDKLGGPVVDNTNTPGCQFSDNGKPYSCRPLTWKTVPEYLQEANITFRAYQDFDNFDEDLLFAWSQYQKSAQEKTDLAKHGMSFPGLHKFFEDAENGNLPEISYIFVPAHLSEHPPYMPQDGAWLHRKVLESLMKSKSWNNTALVVSYDETGGWGDHVLGPLAPRDEPGEWMEDPFHSKLGWQPTGPGFRVPFYIASPFTRKGGVFTEHAAHESQTLFMEEWAKVHGKPFHVKEMNPWRRKHMSNLVNAFDFSKIDSSKPDIPSVPHPHKDPIRDQYNGAFVCQLKYRNKILPEIPYGQQKEEDALKVERGYKPVRGNLSEGRFLRFESDGHALTFQDGNKLTTKKSNDKYDKNALFVLHWQGSNPSENRFQISNRDKSKFVTSDLRLSGNDQAADFAVQDNGNGKGHTIIERQSKKHLSIDSDGNLSLKDDDKPTKFRTFSVSV